MATERNANQVPSLTLKSNAGNNADVIGWADPATHRLLVDIGSGGTSGTQYTDGESTPTHPIGNALIFDNAGTMTDVSDVNPLPVSATISTAGLATSAKQDTIIGHIDGVETLLGTIDADTGNIATSVASIDTKTPALGQALAAASMPVVLTAAQVTTLTPPAAITGYLTESDFDTKTGSLTETAPVTDTASSGLNGRLQRIAQRITSLIAAIGSPFQAGGSIGNTTFAATQSGTWDEVGINDSGNSITVDYATTGSGTATGALRVELPTNGTGVIATVGAVTAITNALPAGTNAIGKLAANSGVDIGDVDVTSAVITGGAVADDTGSTGNPIMIGGFAISPDGTDPGSVSAEADAAKARMDLNRRLLVNTEHPRWWSYHADGSTALTDASVQADPGDGFQIVITDIIFSNGAATAINLFLEEGSTKILGPVYLEAINGRGFVWKGKKHVTASTAVTVTTSSSTAHSVDILGYIQAV